jgi:hypothetical protein
MRSKETREFDSFYIDLICRKILDAYAKREKRNWKFRDMLAYSGGYKKINRIRI